MPKTHSDGFADERAANAGEVFLGRFIANLGALVVELHFESRTRLTFTILDGGGLAEVGYRETVDTTMVEIRPNVFFTSWKERSGATVTHFEDFEREVLHSNATLPDGRFVRMSGTLTRADETVSRVFGPAKNKEIVLRGMKELFEDGDLSALDRFWKDPYVQHNPTMRGGLDEIRAIIPTLRGFRWTPARVVAEGDLVMAHSRVLGWATQPVIIVDIFRLEAGRIVEHWDVVQEEVASTSTASGAAMI
jgi:predicted SnoaL-like aldol condensation-catalyzing enzyme